MTNIYLTQKSQNNFYDYSQNNSLDKSPHRNTKSTINNLGNRGFLKSLIIKERNNDVTKDIKYIFTTKWSTISIDKEDYNVTENSLIDDSIRYLELHNWLINLTK